MSELDEIGRRAVEQALLRSVHRTMLWPRDPHRELTLVYEPDRIVGKFLNGAKVEALPNGNLRLIEGEFRRIYAYVAQRYEEWVELLPNGEYKRLPVVEYVDGRYVEYLPDRSERVLDVKWLDCHKEHRRVGSAYVHIDVGKNPLEAIVAVEEAFERDIIGLFKPIEALVNYALRHLQNEQRKYFKSYAFDRVEELKEELHEKMPHWCRMFLYFIIDEVERRVKCSLNQRVYEFCHDQPEAPMPSWDEIISPWKHPNCAYSRWLDSRRLLWRDGVRVYLGYDTLKCEYAKDLLSRLRQQLNEYKREWEQSFRYQRW